jgi:putative oxidoreductase
LGNRLNTFAPLFLGMLRIVVGLLFLEHGSQKLLGFPAPLGEAHPLDTLTLASGVLELGLGLLIAIGLFTRVAAFLASGEMAVAYWMMHAPTNFYPVNNMGDAAILYCFVFLYLVFAGPGIFSIDRTRPRRVTSADM